MTKVLSLLNKLNELDSKSLQTLLFSRVICNPVLLDDEDILVRQDEDLISLSALGILNSILNLYNIPKVIAEFNADGRFVGFAAAEEPVSIQPGILDNGEDL